MSTINDLDVSDLDTALIRATSELMISVSMRQMEIEVSAMYESIEVIDQYGTSKYSDYECTRDRVEL